jgi:uroporphyrinogen-III synthase
MSGSNRVAVTRPRERSAYEIELLRSHGFVPIVRRLIRIESDVAALAASVDDLAAYDWLLFTSAEAVRSLDIARRNAHLSWPSRIRAACVGPATAKAASQTGLTIGLIPDVFDGAALAESLLRDTRAASERFFWPRAEAANSGLADRLRAAGARVDDVIAYRTIANSCGAQRLKRDLAAGTIGVILFFSPSAVDSFVELVGVDAVGPSVVVGVIGRSSGDRARLKGLAVHVQPAMHTTRALAEGLREFVDKHEG